MIRKTSAIAITLLATSGAALAQGRPDSTRMTCSQAAALVQAQGGLVLGTGGMTYDRYVSDKRFCAATERLQEAFVPSADAPRCFVGYTCIETTTSPADAK